MKWREPQVPRETFCSLNLNIEVVICVCSVGSLRERMTLSPRLLLLFLFVAAGIAGCASPRSAQHSAAAEAAAIGTWRYEVEGYAPLDEGTFQIMKKNGRLQGLLRDRRRGRYRVRVDLRDSRLELKVDDLRISGYIENGTFTGFLRPQRWSVVSRRQQRSRSRFRSTSLYARRIQSAAAADKPSILDCRPILREDSGCN